MILALYGEGHYHGLYLGTWLSRKRKLYHEKKLPAQLQETLNAMNMDWRTSFERKWDEQAQRTKAFVDAHGHLPDETEDKALALWCRRQKARKPGELTARQIEQLAALGISGHRRESWNDYLAGARAFVQAHGHLHVPLSYVSEQGLKLGEWICKQRQAYHNGKLSEKRIARLKEVHMCWEDPVPKDRRVCLCQAVSRETARSACSIILSNGRWLSAGGMAQQETCALSQQYAQAIADQPSG
ncbi:MAG: helicase associated domain-containing protein [Merdibacter sp.]